MKNINRREFVSSAGLATGAIATAFGFAPKAQGQAAPDKKPNIVFVLTDNLGYGEIGCYGGGLTRGAATPRIDSLAKSGMRLLNMNMETQCTPSRASLMTGRWAIRSVWDLPGG
jgi:arylsulfatase